MPSRYKNAFYIIALIATYSLLFYLLSEQQLNNDFDTFYSAALAYSKHLSPYHHLSSSFLNQPEALAVNVNPPFFIVFISSIGFFDYSTASLIWALSSLFLGLIGWLLCFYLSTSRSFIKKNFLACTLIYFATYPSLMNTSFNQVAGFLLFFIMLGYYFFKKEHDYYCGFFWGLAVALKLFPGLLLFFVLIEKRFKVFWTMSLVILLALILPALTYGSEIYLQFYNTISTIIWYGNTWNASLLAYLFRLFIDTNQLDYLVTIKIVYLALFLGLVGYYVSKLKQLHSSHYRFCLSLMMMLLLSPFGWMYYFDLLLPALLVIYQHLTQANQQRGILLWSLCLILLNLPLENKQTQELSSFLVKSSYFSIYFYGLLMTLGLFLYVTRGNNNTLLTSNKNSSAYLLVLEFILGFSVFVVFYTLLKYFILNYGI